jgi:NADH dehydrogenase/NADH:ubiquinone oxidoreductase subunit G
VVEIVKDDKGQPARQEDAVLSGFGIDTSNFAVTRLDYEDAVERQIQQQQELTMKVQTAVAASKEAEQRAITVAKEGEANAASAKWAQEVEKAKAVTLAQQQFEVATRWRRRPPRQKKRAEILLGEGEATRKRLVMQADGALEKKLAAYVETQKNWADAMARMTQPVVPGVSMGSGDGKGGNGVTQMMEILGAKAARDLQLELKAAK